MNSTSLTSPHRPTHAAAQSALSAILLVSAVQFAVAANTTATSALATPDQKEVESLALHLVASPEVTKQKEETRKQLLADPISKSSEGRKSVQKAVDELAFSAALGAANSDPANPKLTWIWTAPRTWLGHHVPGSRWGMDNPDNVYRFVTVDGVSKYEITVRPKQPGPAQFSFLLYDSFAGENTKQKNLDDPIDGLRDRDLKPEADGSYKITLDNSPANGRKNHIRSNSDAKILIVRNTLNDWARQDTQEVTIKRVGGEAVKPQGEKELTRTTVDYLKAETDSLLAIQHKGQWSGSQPNVLNKPFIRGGNWGFASTGTFKFGKDEAVLLTLDPAGAKYLNVVVYDPWLVSREYVHANGNLNNVAATPNKDGTFTYVISAKDVGIHNWLDTGGLHEGRILIRWQALPEGTKSADNAVREVKVVKLDELAKVLPPETNKVSPGQRKELYAQRAQAYAHRYLTN